MDPCVAADVLVVLLGCLPGRLGRWLCCWSPDVAVSELLLGGFEKIQTTLIVRFAIYLTNVDNADAKCHEIQFSNKCCFLLGFFLLSSVNMYSRNLVILLMFVCGAKAHLGLSLLLEEKRYYFQVILCLKERQEPHVKKVHS